MPASDSLTHPLARDGPSWHCPASLGHRTRQGLTGSVQNLSERAIPNHSTGLAGVFTHSALRLHGNPKPLRQRTSPSTEGWSSLPSHHGFTVRYGSLVCLRPTRFHLTVDTLPLLAIPLEWGNLQEQDFHLQASVPASRTVTHRQGGATTQRIIRVWGRCNPCRNRCFDHKDLFAGAPHNPLAEYSVSLNLYLPLFCTRSLDYKTP